MRWWLALWLLWPFLPGLAAPTDPFPKIARAYLVARDGAVLWARQPAQRLAPASLTKLMTVLLVLEQGESPQALNVLVTVSPAAARATGARLGLRAGERLTVHDLLAATLLVSANDACLALAEHVALNQGSFVARMNARAKQLGLQNTRFTNACGFDAPGHYASAADLARLAQTLMASHPLVLQLAGQSAMQVRSADASRRFDLRNTNALIGRYPGAQGLKTGSTGQAGRCLVAVAQREAVQVVLVLMHGSDRWWDAADVLDLAFAHAPP